MKLENYHINGIIIVLCFIIGIVAGILIAPCIAGILAVLIIWVLFNLCSMFKLWRE